MGISRREFLNITGLFAGGYVISIPRQGMLLEIGLDLEGPIAEKSVDPDKWPLTYVDAGERLLQRIGKFSEINPTSFVFDENKYTQSKRQVKPAEWAAKNRHLPIKFAPEVINKPGERSPEALRRVVKYTQFNNPRYVAAAGERVTMCNIAAWDWSRALQVHLPHWIGETEMSANMLFRWISNSQAGGIYGEGWQPVSSQAAQFLANRGVPVFALAENPTPQRHGHVCMVYPEKLAEQAGVVGGGPYFATVANGRSHGGNGIKNIGSTFRRLKPTYFVHKHDYILYQVS